MNSSGRAVALISLGVGEVNPGLRLWEFDLIGLRVGAGWRESGGATFSASVTATVRFSWHVRE